MGKVKMLDWLFGLNSKTYGMPGGSNTVCPYSYSFNDPYQSDHGASQRHVFDIADWDRSETVIPTGISGIREALTIAIRLSCTSTTGTMPTIFSEGESEGNCRYQHEIFA